MGVGAGEVGPGISGSASGGGGAGTVTSVTAADPSLVQGGTSTINPTFTTRGTFAQAVATTNVAALTGVVVQDGYTPSAGDVTLLVNQTTASQNGLWTNNAGAWTRPANFASASTVLGLQVFVVNTGSYAAGGGIQSDTIWGLNTPQAGLTIDTTAQVWDRIATQPLVNLPVQTTSVNVTDRQIVRFDTTSGALTATLLAPYSGAQNVIKIVAGTNTLTIAANAGAHFNTTTGPTTLVLSNINEEVWLQYYPASSVWVVLSHSLEGVALLASPAFTGAPTAPTQAATDNTTKIASTAYVTTAIGNAVAGVNPADAANAATIAAGDTSGWTYNNGVSGVGATFTGPVNTAIVIDGFTFTAVNQELLVKNDTQSPSGAFNGLYTLTALQTVGTGAIFTRSLDYDTPSEMNNTGSIPVQSGTVNATTSWLLTSNVTTVGTSPLIYVQFSVAPARLNLVITAISSNVAAGTTVLVTAGGTTQTVPAHAANQWVTIKQENGTTGQTSIAVTGGGNIDNVASPYTIASGDSVTLVDDGTNWWVI